MTATFIIMRLESGGYWPPHGPKVVPMTQKEAAKEIDRLQKQYPYQEFEVFGGCGKARIDNKVKFKFTTPVLAEPKPMKPPKPAENVVPMKVKAAKA